MVFRVGTLQQPIFDRAVPLRWVISLGFRQNNGIFYVVQSTIEGGEGEFDRLRRSDHGPAGRLRPG